MADDEDVKRIPVGEDFYILSLSGSSRGGDQMRQQAAEAMERVREQTDEAETDDAAGDDE